MSLSGRELHSAESSVDLVLSYVTNQDAAAADRIYYRHRDSILKLARAGMSTPLRSRVDAEDVYQSVSLILLNGLRNGRFQIQRAGDLRALIAQLTRQRILKKAEHHSADKRAVRRETRSLRSRKIRCGRVPPSVEAEEADVIECLLRTTVNPRHRAVIRLALNGADVPQIANQCEYSQARVRQILESLAARAQREHGDHDRR